MRATLGRRQSLAGVLALSFATVAVIVSITLSLLLGGLSGNKNRQVIGDSLLELAEQVRQRLDIGMGERLHDVQVIASMQQFQHPHIWHDADRRVLEQLKQAFPQYAWIGFAERDGTIRYATQGWLEGQNGSRHPWFRNGLQGPYTGDMHEARELAPLLPASAARNPGYVVELATPVRDSDGALVGVLGAYLLWEWVNDVVQAVSSPSRRDQRVEIFIIGKEGQILLAPPGGQGIAPPRFGKESSGVRTLTWPDGNDYLTASSLTQGLGDYRGLGWRVVVRQAVSDAFQPIHDLQWAILIAGIFAAGIFALLGVWLARALAQPLLELAQAADRLQRGEGDVPIPESAAYREAGHLSASLRHLVAGLTAERNKLATLNTTLEEQVRERTAMLDRANTHLLNTLEDRTQLVQQLETLASTDSLTGLLNRRAFFERAAHEWKQADRHGLPLSVIALDVDHFKKINDRYGHEAGDTALRQLADTCRSELRDVDLIARFGGEEFVVLLPHTTQAAAEQVAERLRNAINATQVEAAGTQFGFTVSMGVAGRAHAATLERLLALADEMLYTAKRDGRDRVWAI
ncbi:diguanylate cyclase [Chitiniphilus purpureus]|uniref:diguanylate cyclase n=1 Tax=Chitiniphilus purpureus TaxID=2981137 RepID=A0ABY6DI16_9NEIS|nr:diguanylate cyclase [Chitiniphilus sp. CD1]UXY13994.1 diguanylate cyclase [Chitiniphilus sp. CD1]